jgi:hypothetical protein
VIARRLALLVMVVLLVGCGGGADREAPETPAMATPGAVRTPGEVASDQRFGFDEVAEYPDGLQIEVSGAAATRAEAKDQGAESTGGEIVSAVVRIGNNRELPYDASAVRVSVTYGNGTVAPLVLDNTGDLQRGFTGAVPVAGEATAPMAFAVPFSALAAVTFVVDPGDDQHEPVSFTGQVRRE